MTERRAFTMIEMLTAVLLVGILTTLSVLTFNAVSRSWQISTDYMDKMQRTDYALNQVISGLRSMYYPHDGKQDERYGFALDNKGEGENPRESDIITWSKKGSAIVGTTSAIADTVHRVQVMVLEEGNNDYREPIEVTGLYARLCGDGALIPDDPDDETDYSLANEDLYQPLLIADGIVGFNCRVLKTEEDAGGGTRNESANDKDKFEDEFAESNSVPYKVELTFHISNPDGTGHRSDTAPLVRIIRIPIHEQSLDGSQPPTEEGKDAGGGAKGGAPPKGGG